VTGRIAETSQVDLAGVAAFIAAATADQEMVAARRFCVTLQYWEDEGAWFVFDRVDFKERISADGSGDLGGSRLHGLVLFIIGPVLPGSNASFEISSIHSI
jgi:hypothetical protein